MSDIVIFLLLFLSVIAHFERHLNSGIVCNNAEFAPRREKSMRGASTAPAGRDTVAHPRVKESPVTPGAVKAKESPSLREKAR